MNMNIFNLGVSLFKVLGSFSHINSQVKGDRNSYQDENLYIKKKKKKRDPLKSMDSRVGLKINKILIKIKIH